MAFNSFEYVAFLGVIVVASYLLPSLLSRCGLLAASFFFYMCWNVKYSLLMLLSIVITYITGLLLEKYTTTRLRKLFLFGGIVANLAILIYFKYFNFLMDCLNSIFSSDISFIEVLLPVGISFYTFQAIGYTVDVYRRKVNAEHNFINYALFVSFFPQLVAGPIERSVNMLAQFKQKPKFNMDNLKDGATLLLYGFFEKIVVADTLSMLTDGIFDNYKQMSPILLVLGGVFFSIQIYADFSSYTHIARGSAKMMGYTLMKNFDSPFLAENIQNFWKRWHISLTSWFTDYLYIPLGGNRVKPFRIYINIILVFLFSGLWHGANLTYLVWGALHAIAQVAFRLYSKYIGIKLKGINWFITYLFVCFSFIFFRAPSLEFAGSYLAQIFTAQNSFAQALDVIGISTSEFIVALALVAVIFLFDIARKKIGDVIPWFNTKPLIIQSLMYTGLMVSIVVLGMYGSRYVAKPFIYFQF